MTTAFEISVKQLKPEKMSLLKEGKVGSRLATYSNGIQAVVKIASTVATKRNRELQRGLPVTTFPRREVAFYRLCKILHKYDPKFEVVPETILGEFEGVTASYQQYTTSARLVAIEPRLRKPNDREMWAISLRETLRDKLPPSDTLRLTVLDYLACSRDRHAANYGARLDIVDGKACWRAIGWDNGCSFGLTQKNYHCVAHKYLFRFAMDLEPVWDALQKIQRSDLVSGLGGLLLDEEIDHVWLRVQFMLLFPHRMPWITLSQGNDDVDSFPTYEKFFTPMANIAKPIYIMNTV